MRRNGAILACLLFLLTVGFSSESKARGFLDAVFGSEQLSSPAQLYLAPQGEGYRHRQAYRGDIHNRQTKSHYLRHSSSMRVRPAKHRVVFDTSVRARVYAHRSMTQYHSSKAIQSASPPSLERPCCSNAQEAINHIVNNDPTLRPGDAYMSHEGLRVYVGERKRDAQFVPVEHARQIGAGLRQRLKEVGATPRKGVRTPDEKARNHGHDPQPSVARAGRSGEKLVAGPEGRPIRLVGGFAK